MVNKNIVRTSIILLSVMLAAVAVKLIFMRPAGGKSVNGPVSSDRTPAKVKPQALKEAKALLAKGDRAGAVRKLEALSASSEDRRQRYEALLLLADIYNSDTNFIRAKEAYLKIIDEYPELCDYAYIQERIASIRMAVLFSDVPTPDSELYKVIPGDSLAKIAKEYSTTVSLIKKANGLTSDVIMPGMKLKVQRVPFNIVVDKSQSTLTLFLGDEVMKTYIVSTGKNNSTPTGVFRIKDKLIEPIWYNQGVAIPADSPKNVLGSRWMGLTTEEPGYGIHGTVEPESIGYQCTDGCVRMKNSDVEELYLIIPVGTSVTIVD